MNADVDALRPNGALPAELCKFRTFGAERAGGADEQTVYDMLRGRLRFSFADSFNDPFEARPQHRAAHDDPSAQRAALVKYLAEIAPDGGSPAQRRRWAEGWLAGKTLQDVVTLMDDAHGDGRNRHDAALLCLSHPDTLSRPLLWSHYADSHRGLCLHLDTGVSPVRFAWEVEYSEEYPTILVPRTAGTPFDVARSTYLTKCDLWAYEHEYRIIRMLLPNAGMSRNLLTRWEGNVALCAPQVVRAVTLGCRMPEIVQQRFTSWLSEHAPHVELWKAQLHRHRFELTRERIV